ncbi:Uncharacterized protein conserved in archaea [Archaeoglobus sulfaticallidus PM70-1]|uniref:Dihydroneopterin aldolase n=1 Tax=Archaeoglobus sulfaticallidus PM70-1 TaxID=387631 RepID=N0BNQ9_9EURY|nr:Uncharacterized protein conserved in archaea [Archaeoglobus sulfaticallidus PM70-1]
MKDVVNEEKIACFEAGIKLGALFHQFVGAPVSLENARILEMAMESCMRLQPFVVSAEVKIDRERLKEMVSSFGYISLSGELIRARVTVKVGETLARAELYWDDEKKYPMMRLI